MSSTFEETFVTDTTADVPAHLAEVQEEITRTTNVVDDLGAWYLIDEVESLINKDYARDSLLDCVSDQEDSEDDEQATTRPQRSLAELHASIKPVDKSAHSA
ncbi:hypothetical protein LTR66_016307, partial [Elasticomyces elasticus]